MTADRRLVREPSLRSPTWRRGALARGAPACVVADAALALAPPGATAQAPTPTPVPAQAHPPTGMLDGFDGPITVLFEYKRDGQPPTLVAGGTFTSVSGRAASGVAEWDGRAWRPLALGSTVMESFHGPAPGAGPYAFIVFDDGTGPALYAGGFFTRFGGVIAHSIVKRVGLSWRQVADGLEPEQHSTSLEPTVSALAVFDDGAGPALYAGGELSNPGKSERGGVARLDGDTWTMIGLNPAPGDPSPIVRALKVFEGGERPLLYAGGDFSALGGVPANSVAGWDGSAWSPLGSGVDGYVDAIEVFDDGNGPVVYVAGRFDTAGGVVVNNIAKWDGQNWSGLHFGVTGSTSRHSRLPRVTTLRAVAFADGERLVAAGEFSHAGGIETGGLAAWDGARWSALTQAPAGSVSAIAQVAADRRNRTLFVAGSGVPTGASSLGEIRTGAVVPPDLSGDGVVNMLDLSIVLNDFGRTDSPFDLTGDGVVNGADLAVIFNDFAAP